MTWNIIINLISQWTSCGRWLKNGAWKGRLRYSFPQLFIMDISNRKKSVCPNLKLIYLIRLNRFQSKWFPLAVAWTDIRLNPDTCWLYVRWPGERVLIGCLSHERLWKAKYYESPFTQALVWERFFLYCFCKRQLRCYQIRNCKLAPSLSLC